MGQGEPLECPRQPPLVPAAKSCERGTPRDRPPNCSPISACQNPSVDPSVLTQLTQIGFSQDKCQLLNCLGFNKNKNGSILAFYTDQPTLAVSRCICIHSLFWLTSPIHKTRKNPTAKKTWAALQIYVANLLITSICVIYTRKSNHPSQYEWKRHSNHLKLLKKIYPESNCIPLNFTG